MSKLDLLLKRDCNSLDFFRFLAALLVIFSHSYPLSMGTQYEQKYEPLIVVSNHQMTLGTFAVAIFFIISGFLISASLDRSRSWISYIIARFMRIVPGLVVVVL